MEFSVKSYHNFCNAIDVLMRDYDFSFFIEEGKTVDLFKEWLHSLPDETEGVYYDGSDDDWDDVGRYFTKLGLTVSFGASKVVLLLDSEPNWVIKIPFEGLRKDYCKEEVRIYENAVIDGVENFFAEAGFAGFYEGVPIYFMRKATIDKDEVYNEYFNMMLSNGKSEDEAYDLSNEAEDNCTFFDELRCEYYTEEENELWDTFNIDFQIDDLHNGNIGFIDGRLVVIDYSGYQG